jgi:hypothetical protein
MAKKTEAKRSYKLDIMTVLQSADLGEKQFYANLTEEEQKAFVPRVLVRWLSTVGDRSAYQAYSLLATNDLVNLNLWSLSKHPELLWLLMCVAGAGQKQYHQWVPTKSKPSGTPKLDQFVRTHWPTANSVEQQILKSSNTAEDWIQLASSSGISDSSLKELKDEFKKAAKAAGD